MGIADVISPIIAILVVGGFIYLIYAAIRYGGQNLPTWTGIIVSALIGLLVPYLILCFFGIMGEKRDN